MFKKDHMELLENIHDYGVNLSTREIFLNSTHHTEEGEEGGVDFEMAYKFIKNIQLLQSISDETIIIHACSCGGDWNYGIAIYDAIASCNCKTILVSHANARSMSSIIPQAATWRLIMPNCDFMIHLLEQ
jgi:ATP-dependent protease ClpP protease subunit